MAKESDMRKYLMIKHDEQLEDAFDTSSKYFKEMMKIISTSNKDKCPLHKHHIVPRSWFTKNGYEVDNSDDNIAYITPYEHCMVHYYAWKCAKKIIKRSMAYAFRLMYNIAFKNIENVSSVSAIAVEYQKSLVTTSVSSVNERLSKLGSSFICKSIKNKKILFHCKECGFEKYVGFSWHSKEARCPTCYFKSSRPYEGKYVLVKAILRDNHAYYLTAELPPNKYGCYNWDKLNTFAKRMINDYGDNIKKWTIVGTTNTKYKYPKLPPWDKDIIKRFVYWYKTDKSMCGHIITNFNSKDVFNTILKACKHYNIEAPAYSPGRTFTNHIYYIEEFDDFHTLEEWQEILGCSRFDIRKNYNIEDCGFFNAKEMLDYMLSLIKETHSLKVLDAFYDEIVSEAIRNDFIDEDKI